MILKKNKDKKKGKKTKGIKNFILKNWFGREKTKRLKKGQKKFYYMIQY